MLPEYRRQGCIVYSMIDTCWLIGFCIGVVAPLISTPNKSVVIALISILAGVGIWESVSVTSAAGKLVVSPLC